MGDTDTATEVPEGTTPEAVTEGQPAIPEGTEPVDLEATYVVRIGGEDVEITLGEALKGYQRQADYTRKTQEASQKVREAEEALQLQRALRANPQKTLEVLSEHYGVRFTHEDNDDYEEVDPRLVEVQSKLDQLTGLLNQQAFEREIAQLEQTFGPDVDVDVVVEHMRRGNFPTLKAAAADLLIDDVLPVYKQHARRAQEDAVIVGLKRQVSVAAPGSSGSEPPTAVAGGSNRLSVRESAELARQGKTVRRWHPDDWKKKK